MENREFVVSMMGDLNREGGTVETLAIALLLNVLLDIRDQNEEMLKILKSDN